VFKREFNDVDRAQLLYVIIGVATADWLFGKEEFDLIENIARKLEVPEVTVIAHFAMFRYQKQWRDKWEEEEDTGESWRFGSSGQEFNPKSSFSLEAAYQILEMIASNTDKEIKKAYRKLALKFHPDRVLHLGKEQQKMAKEKFLKVSEAYELIGKSRRDSGKV
jgi:DnaJ-domain-containing protein 1